MRTDTRQLPSSCFSVDLNRQAIFLFIRPLFSSLLFYGTLKHATRFVALCGCRVFIASRVYVNQARLYSALYTY